MPTEKSLYKLTDYNSILDEVYEISAKYNKESTFAWMDDMNAFFNRPHQSGNDIQFKRYCQENG